LERLQNEWNLKNARRENCRSSRNKKRKCLGDKFMSSDKLIELFVIYIYIYIGIKLFNKTLRQRINFVKSLKDNSLIDSQQNFR
jgi:hypothetical protein